MSLYVLCAVALDTGVDNLATLRRGLEGVESYGVLRNAKAHASAVAKAVWCIGIGKAAG